VGNKARDVLENLKENASVKNSKMPKLKGIGIHNFLIKLIVGKKKTVIMNARFHGGLNIDKPKMGLICNCVFDHTAHSEPEWTDEMRDWIDQQRREWKASLKEDQP